MSVPSGIVYFCKNALVSYTHTIDFKDPSEQLAYWGSLVKFTTSEWSYIRRESQILRVDKKLDYLQDVNYLYFRSSEDSKLYFCYVDNKKYVNENLSEIYFHTDVMQTYMFDYKVLDSYVLQEHCDRWDVDHKPIYSITDEGLDYGNEYVTESGYKIISNEETDRWWYLALCAPHNELVTEGANATEPTVLQGTALPYIIYLIPCNEYDHGLYEPYKVTIGDIETDTRNIGGIARFTKLMSEDSGLGEFVKQIVKIPYLPFKYTYNDNDGVIDFRVSTKPLSEYYSLSLEFTKIKDYNLLKITRIENMSVLSLKLAEMDWNEGIKEAMPTAEQWEEVRANPYTTERDRRFESKLLTHPYRYNLLTDWRTSPCVIKNEYLSGDKIKVNFTQSISFNSPVRFWVEGYRRDPEGRGASVVQLVPEETPVITDAYYTYMLENKNQIKASQENAIMSAVTNTGLAVAGGVASGGMTGGPVGAVVGGIMGGLSSAARGVTDIANLVRSQNAKQKDLKNLPDTIINSNDGAFNIIDRNRYITFYRYKICCEFEEQLANVFNMSGYTVKRVKKPNLRTRARFNYVKTVGANIVGSFDQNDLAQIKAIFDNGVTFWHYHKDHFKMFDYSLENIETKLI